MITASFIVPDVHSVFVCCVTKGMWSFRWHDQTLTGDTQCVLHAWYLFTDAICISHFTYITICHSHSQVQLMKPVCQRLLVPAKNDSKTVRTHTTKKCLKTPGCVSLIPLLCEGVRDATFNIYCQRCCKTIQNKPSVLIVSAQGEWKHTTLRWESNVVRSASCTFCVIRLTLAQQPNGGVW